MLYHPDPPSRRSFLDFPGLDAFLCGWANVSSGSPLEVENLSSKSRHSNSSPPITSRGRLFHSLNMNPSLIGQAEKNGCKCHRSSRPIRKLCHPMSCRRIFEFPTVGCKLFHAVTGEYATGPFKARRIRWLHALAIMFGEAVTLVEVALTRGLQFMSQSQLVPIFIQCLLYGMIDVFFSRLVIVEAHLHFPSAETNNGVAPNITRSGPLRDLLLQLRVFGLSAVATFLPPF